MYRISQNGQEPIIDVDTVDQIEPAIRSIEPGRYRVDGISADLLPSGRTLDDGVSGSSEATEQWSLSLIRGTNDCLP
jgi:hypothetical protein